MFSRRPGAGGRFNRRNIGAARSAAAAASAESSPLVIISSVNVLFWGRADQIVQSGGFVDEFTDLSGNGNSFTAADTARPAVLASVAAINGKPAISADGTDDTMVASTLIRVAPGTAPTWYSMVIQQRAHTTTERIINCQSATTTCMILQQITASPNIRQFSGSAANANGGLAVGTWERVEALYSNTINDYIQAGSVNVGGTASGGDTAFSAGMRLFASHTPGLFSAIDMAELIVTDGAPNIAELSALDAYYFSASRYGVL